MWFAPALGYVPVQAERERGGKLEFAMRIKSSESLSAARLRALPAAPQVFGSVTPRWPWYLPPRSRYEVSHTSSDSKNSICATPSLA